MRGARAAWLLAAALAAASAGAQPRLLSRQFELRQEAAFFTGEVETQKLRSQVSAKAELALTPKLTLKAEARGWYDLRYDLDSDYRAATAGRGRRRAELREALLHAALGSTDLTVGQQIVSWGKADRLRVLDVVNPIDLREFVLEELSDSKIPLVMLNAQHYFGGATAQLLLIPEQKGNRLAPFGSDFYDRFHDPARADALPLDGPKDWKLEDLGIGLQLSGRLGRTDLSLNFLSAYDGNFTLDWRPRPAPGGLALEPTRVIPRVHAIGGSFARPLGSWLARGELVYASGRQFARGLPDVLANPRGGGVTRGDNLIALVAADRTWNSTFFSVQVALDSVARRPLLDRAPHELLATLLCWRDFRNATWRAQMLAIWQANEGAWLFQPRLGHQVTSAVHAAAGADLVAGGALGGLWGQFRRANRAVFTVEYQF